MNHKNNKNNMNERLRTSGSSSSGGGRSSMSTGPYAFMTKNNRYMLRPSTTATMSATAQCVSPFCRDPNCAVPIGESDNDMVPPQLMYCSVIGGGGNASDSDPEDGGSSLEIDDVAMINNKNNNSYYSYYANTGMTQRVGYQNNQLPQQPRPDVFFQVQRPGSGKTIATGLTAVTTTQQQQQQSSVEVETWKDKLLKVSNWASFLCVLDCTVLPILTILLPLVSGSSGLIGGENANVMGEWLHELGHSVAIWFVLPVGTLATLTNYFFSHRQIWISLLGTIGLVLIGCANAGCHSSGGIFHHGGLVSMMLPHALFHAIHQLMHLLHHGIIHRIANITGCALLMGSNYLSKRYTAKRNAAKGIIGGSSCIDPYCNNC